MSNQQDQQADDGVNAKLDGPDASLYLGGPETPGLIAITDGEGNTTVEYRGDRGAVVVGGDGHAGSVVIRNGDGRVAGEIAAEGEDLVFRSADGTPALTIEADGTIRTAGPVRPAEGGRGRGEGR